MPDCLVPAQIRGARGMLDWSMVDLAMAASLSVATVKRVEQEAAQPASHEAHRAIRQALEDAGVEFLHDAGQVVGVKLGLRSCAVGPAPLDRPAAR